MNAAELGISLAKVIGVGLVLGAGLPAIFAIAYHWLVGSNGPVSSASSNQASSPPSPETTNSRERMASPASEFSTTSTPWPPVAVITFSANDRLRESKTWSAPRRCTKSRFSSLPTVA